MADWRLQLVRKGDYLNGSFVTAESVDGYINDVNPADLQDTIGRFPFSSESVEKAFHAAGAAAGPWGRRGINERAHYIGNFLHVLQEHKEASAQIISRETGKPIWEARHEVMGTIDFMRVLLDDGMEVLAPRVLGGADGRTSFSPRGIVGIIAPHTPALYEIATQSACAVLAGNSVIIKPSKFTPAVGQHVVELWDRCRLPRGVVNMVQGSGATVGTRIVNHKALGALLFTGSFSTSMAIRKAMFKRPEIPVVFQTGGKGTAIVLGDAEMDQAVYEVLVGAFLSGGQRHSSTSRVFVEESCYDRFMANLVDRAGRIAIGDGGSSPVFMGPLISDSHRRRSLKYLADVEGRSNTSTMLVGGSMKVEGKRGYYCAPSIVSVDHRKGDKLLEKTPPGPILLAYKVSSPAEAAALHNLSPYRQVCSIFSRSGGPENFADSLSTGALNINRATIGMSRRLAGMGLGRSAGHLMTGLGLLKSLTHPKAILREQRTFDPTMVIPGTNWSSAEMWGELDEETEVEDPTTLNLELRER